MIKKYTVTIPEKVHVFYNDTKNMLVIKGPLVQKSLKLDTKVLLEKTKIRVLAASGRNTRDHAKKNIKEKQGTVVSSIKKLLIETSAIIYKRLNIIGVGYRVYMIDDFNNNVLFFRLGLSHHIYFRTPLELNIFCQKLTKVFIMGHSYDNITNTASKIRSKKVPDRYKGKGILLEGEKVELKEGKKI